MAVCVVHGKGKKGAWAISTAEWDRRRKKAVTRRRAGKIFLRPSRGQDECIGDMMSGYGCRLQIDARLLPSSVSCSFVKPSNAHLSRFRHFSQTGSNRGIGEK